MIFSPKKPDTVNPKADPETGLIFARDLRPGDHFCKIGHIAGRDVVLNRSAPMIMLGLHEKHRYDHEESHTPRIHCRHTGERADALRSEFGVCDCYVSADDLVVYRPNANCFRSP